MTWVSRLYQFVVFPFNRLPKRTVVWIEGIGVVFYFLGFYLVDKGENWLFNWIFFFGCILLFSLVARVYLIFRIKFHKPNMIQIECWEHDSFSNFSHQRMVRMIDANQIDGMLNAKKWNKVTGNYFVTIIYFLADTTHPHGFSLCTHLSVAEVKELICDKDIK